MKHLLLLLFCGGILYSCSITKRHFAAGYHVEWNRKIRTTADSRESSKMETSALEVLKNAGETDSLLIDQTEIFDHTVISVLDTKKGIEDQQADESLFQPEAEIQTSEEIKMSKSQVTKETDDEAEEAPKQRMHPLMWEIWGMWSIAIACMFFVTFYAEALIGVALGFFIAMIFALIVLKSLRKNPVKQPFKGLSYGFGIPAVVFGVIASAGVGLILVMFFFA
jgi:hypothetical protein